MTTGDIVTAFYKSGKYIGEITAIHPEHYTVKILAVLRHPAQGDLHHPNEANVPFFHERKALAFCEQANIPAKTVQPFRGEIPDYFETLRDAADKLKSKLQQKDTPFARKSMAALESVQREYELMYGSRWK
ncbi:kinase-associated lipoprotein B [Bacillus xiapuensis]|uniref:kinase-associated lipoprotein B n=1 Tax=Bacillus xiapuensis TaxID=2014075 RepID=UPI000C2337E0|nr:kinase-associated lipoprotein B [Bacillus xiapuensis]